MKWKKAVRDCEKIIQNDNNHIKALYIMGISKIERVKGDAIEWEEILDDGVRNIENAIMIENQKPQSKNLAKMKETLEKGKLIQLLKKKETKQQRILEFKFYVEKLMTGNPQKQAKVRHYVDEYIQKSEVEDPPNHLTCPISFDLYNTPVITTDGHTYEKDLLLQHFSSNGGIDPMTRNNVSKKPIFVNMNIKKLSEKWKLK